MAGRRSDTRERIQNVALELFAEQGYEKTSLREIAERLQVTKAALYYHFRTKEDIVTSLLDDVTASVDKMLEWAREQPRTVEMRQELVRRLARLIETEIGRFMRFMQENQPALKNFQERNPWEQRIQELIMIMGSGAEDPALRLKARLALFALLFGNRPQFDDGLPDEDRAEVALRVALELVSPHGQDAGQAT